MTPEQWQTIRPILESALELDPPRRPAFLDGACADAVLRCEVDSLIGAQERNSNFLEGSAAAEVIPDQNTPPVAAWIAGMKLGPYEIHSWLGAGGMGEVYRAFRADGEYKKEVAIKLVRAGQNSDLVVNRFKNERQILAGLEHPNIARFLDAGTTDGGLPYFAMELVEGQPIDRYCDAHRLPIEERLTLFITVCSAVQHAHQNLVIHRDLKPGNILVTNDHVPKLLDFGIAKILDAPSLPPTVDTTLTVMRVLTPEFASPEQVRGETITTASDVYSLGVILYVLMTGRHPYAFASHSPLDVAKAVCDAELVKPSETIHRCEEDVRSRARGFDQIPESVGAARNAKPEKLRRQLSGDLDNIILTALRKEPKRRYASVEQFAEDIRRHLENMPVLARTDTFVYRTSKFVTRHKIGLAAAALVFLAVSAGLVVTLREARVARMQTARAERRFNDVRKLANALIFDLHDPIRELPGSIHVEKMLVDTSLQYLDSLAQETESDFSLQRELAEAYQRLGNAQGSPYGPNLGDPIGALASYRKALRLRQTALKSNPHDIQGQIRLGSNYRTIGSLLARMGDLPGARDSVRQALGITQAVAQQAQDEPRAIKELGVDFLTLGDVEGNALGFGIIESPELALQYHRKALEVNQKWIALAPSERVPQEQAAFDSNVVAADLIQGGRPEEAIQYANQALAILERVASSADAAIRLALKDSIATTHSQIGNALLVSGNPRKAIPEFNAELSIFKYLSDADPGNAMGRQELSSAYLDLGAAWISFGDTRTGLQYLQNGIEIAEQRPVTDPGVAGMLASGYIDQGDAFEKMKDAPRALSAYTKAEKLFESPALFKPGNFADTLQAAAGGKIAGALAKLGKMPQADEKYRSALRQVEPAASAIPPNLRAQYIRADLFAGLGDLLSRRAARGGAEAANAWREARKCYEKSLEAWHRLPLRTATASILFDITAPKTIARNLALCKHAIEQLEDTDSRPVISPELPAALHKARKSGIGVAKNISD